MEIMFPHVKPGVFKFQPTPEDTFLALGTKKPQRVIFAEIALRAEEEKALDAFRALASSKGKVFPSWVDNKDRFVLRFLQGNSFDFQKTLKSLEDHLEWRVSNLPVDKDEIEQYLDAGLMYFLGFDKSYRPILVINVKAVADASLPNEILSKLTIYMMEFATSNLFIPGKAESMIVIGDMTGVGTLGVPVSSLRGIVEMLQNNYRARLCQLFVFKAPTLVKGLWTIVKAFLEDATIAKIHLGESDFAELHKTVDPSQLEKRFGGTHENLTHDFFPPQNI